MYKTNTVKLVDSFNECYSNLLPFRDDLEYKEDLFISKVSDNISNNVAKSKVSDPRLTTIILERVARNVAQLSTGVIKYGGNQNTVQSYLMNKVITEYINPNANTQYDQLTKLKLLSLYSQVYGSMCVLVDYFISPLYTGPDFTIIPIRQIVPQVGKYSIEDSDYIYVVNYVSKSFLEGKLKDKKEKSVWDKKAIQELLEKEGDEKNTEYETNIEKTTQTKTSAKETYELITKYERDKWTTFSKERGIIIRESDNPHENNDLPIIKKDAFPLLDRFFGLGEYERGKTLQYALDSLWNYYLDGVAMSIRPPLLVDYVNVVSSSLTYQAGSKIQVSSPNAITPLNVGSSQSINTFQNTYQALLGAILNQAGTTDTSVSKAVDPGMGKTPQAIKYQQGRQNARDSWDKYMMDKFTEKLYNKYIDLICIKQSKPIRIPISQEEVVTTSDKYSNIGKYTELIGSEDNMEMIVKIGDIVKKPNPYRYFVDMGSTVQVDNAEQNGVLTSIIELVIKSPQVLEVLNKSGKDIDFAELIKRWLMTSGIKQYDKILIDKKQEPLTPEPLPENSNMQGGAMPMQGAQPMPQQPIPIEQFEQMIAQAFGQQGGQNV